jgi:hypothetical protein
LGKTVFCPLNDQWPVKPLGELRFGAWWFGGRFGVTEWTASNVCDLVGFFEVRFWVGLSVEEVGQVARPFASKAPGFWGPLLLPFQVCFPSAFRFFSSCLQIFLLQGKTKQLLFIIIIITKISYY